VILQDRDCVRQALCQLGKPFILPPIVSIECTMQRDREKERERFLKKGRELERSRELSRVREEDSSRLLEISGPLKKVKDGTRGLSSRTHRHSGESSSSSTARSLPEVPIEVALFSQITAIQMHILEPEEITRYFCPRTVVCAAHLDWSRRAFERRESRILYRQESACRSERGKEFEQP